MDRLKDKYQAEAEKLALEKYDKEFYDLPERTQDSLYDLAMEIVNERLRGGC